MINMIDIESEIEAIFVSILRTVFENDSAFVYNEDERLTGIQISPDFSESKSPHKVPQIVVSDISYNFETQNYMMGNYAEDIRNSNGKVIGVKVCNVIPFTLAIQCSGYKYQARDIANRTLNYLVLGAKDMFAASNVVIQSVSKSPGRPREQFPEQAHDCVLSVRGLVNWQATITQDQKTNPGFEFKSFKVDIRNDIK